MWLQPPSTPAHQAIACTCYPEYVHFTISYVMLFISFRRPVRAPSPNLISCNLGMKLFLFPQGHMRNTNLTLKLIQVITLGLLR